MKTRRGTIVVGAPGLLAATFAMTLASAGVASAQGWIDQYQLSAATAVSAFNGNVYAQEVVPSASEISAVALGLYAFNGPDNVTVEIRNGACDGAGSLVASATAFVSPPSGLLSGETSRINFVPAVAVTPGATYTLRITAANLLAVGMLSAQDNPYPAGRLCFNGVPSNFDVRFATFVGTQDLPANCTPAPVSGCGAAEKGTIKLVDSADDAKDVLQWKYVKPLVAIDALDLGFPDSFTSGGYRVCIYDETASTPAPVLGFYLESETCPPDKPCWKSNSTNTSYKFKRKTGSAAGVISAQLKSGLVGKGKIVLKSKGVAIPLPAPVSINEFFDQDPRLTVQITALDSQKCFENVFDTTTTKTNLPAQFKAVLK